MIKIILSGGLGNQMFQYAAGRALSLHSGAPLSVDLYMLHKKTKSVAREYQLDIFGIALPIISSFRNKLLVKGYKYFISNNVGRYLFDLMHVFNESQIQAYDKRFEFLSSDTTLLGYFQNECYFRKYSREIRQDFSFVKKLDSLNSELLKRIGEENSVSIHIRRGDYLSLNSNLSVLDKQYYEEAIRFIKERVDNPSFFIFSDDIDWVAQNLIIDESSCVYVNWNKGDASYIDMQLISNCKHNIIANSSFSWWGAWLNANPEKLVLVPPTWYKNQEKSDYPSHFIPEEWIIL